MSDHDNPHHDDGDDDFEFGPPDDPFGGEPINEDSRRISLKAAYSMVLGLYLILITASLLFIWNTDSSGWNWGFFLLFATIAHAVAGFRVLEPTEFGAIFFLGIPITECSVGPVWAPPGIIKLETAPRAVIQIEFPGEPEDVQKSNQDVIIPGKKSVIRITHAAYSDAMYAGPAGPMTCRWSELDEKAQGAVLSDPLNRRITSEISGYVRFRIKPGQFIQFIQVTGSFKAALQSIEDTWVSTLQDNMGRLTPSGAITHKAFIGEKLLGELEVLIGERPSPRGRSNRSWGVDLDSTQIKLIDVGHTVNSAMAKASAAEFDRHATVSAAEAEKSRKILEGQGERSRLTDEGEGKAAALDATNKVRIATAKAMAEIAGSQGGQFVLAQETMLEGLSKGRHTIIAPSSSAILGAVAGIKEVLKEGGSGEEK